MGEKPGTCVIVFTWTMVVLTFVFVVLRLLVRTSRCQDAQLTRMARGRYHLPVRLSDIFVVLAWLSFVIEAILWTLLYHNGQFDIPVSLWDPRAVTYMSTKALKLGYVSGLLYLNTCYFVKLAVIFVFEEFIPRERVWMRRALWALLGIVIVAWILRIVSSSFLCFPLSRNWTHDIASSCGMSKSFTISFFVFFTTHPLTDILVYLFPFPTLYPLLRSRALSTSQKLGLVLSFASGLVCIGVVFGYLAATMQPPDSYGGNQTEVLYTLYALEGTYAILVCCAPAVVGDVIAGYYWAKDAMRSRRNASSRGIQKDDSKAGDDAIRGVDSEEGKQRLEDAC